MVTTTRTFSLRSNVLLIVRASDEVLPVYILLFAFAQREANCREELKTSVLSLELFVSEPHVIISTEQSQSESDPEQLETVVLDTKSASMLVEANSSEGERNDDRAATWAVFQTKIHIGKSQAMQ